MDFKNSKYLKYCFPIGISIIILGLITILDKGLAVGLLFIALLTGITFVIISKIKTETKTLYLLFLITLLIHLGVVLFIHYAHFQPFSGGVGDYMTYNKEAQEISQGLRQGTLSLREVIFNSPVLQVTNYYPAVVGLIYRLTLPEVIIGELFNAWLVALSVLFVFLIVQEVTNSKKRAFLIGLIVNIYPSYVFYGSLLLKEALFICLTLAGLFLVLKLIKNFSWTNFLIFYIVLIVTTNLRFYISYVLIFTFIFCWLLISNLNLRKKVIYAIIIIPLLGFLPQISGHGYYGINLFKHFLTPQQITYYREVVYAPPPVPTPEVPTPEVPTPPPPGTASTITVKTGLSNPFSFLGNYLKSFIYVLLGPFPWQMKYSRHFLALIETIPWYFLLFFVIKGIIKSIRNYRIILPLILFSLGTLAILALFISNFGIITRIRIPSFVVLLCLIPLAPNFQNKYLENIENYLTKLWQNI